VTPVERQVALQRLARDLREASPADRFSQITAIKGQMLAAIVDDPARAVDAARLREELADRLRTMRVAGQFAERCLPPVCELATFDVVQAVHRVTGRDVGPDQVRRRRLVREPRALPQPEPIAAPLAIDVADEAPTRRHPLQLVRDEPEPDPPPLHERSLPEILANVADPGRRRIFENP